MKYLSLLYLRMRLADRNLRLPPRKCREPKASQVPALACNADRPHLLRGAQSLELRTFQGFVKPAWLPPPPHQQAIEYLIVCDFSHVYSQT
ncbi:hypothetical protein [Microcoleus sp. herbarium14]|uniref:hypothetical protein n=1 Tax=Microcoleus sp. herbarium14 TaxID=3055439 RepID=UPI002FD75ACB